jgi:hypothetical protein
LLSGPDFYAIVRNQSLPPGSIVRLNERIRARVVEVVNLRNSDVRTILGNYVQYSTFKSVDEWLSHLRRKYHGRLPTKLLLLRILHD